MIKNIKTFFKKLKKSINTKSLEEYYLESAKSVQELEQRILEIQQKRAPWQINRF